MWGEILSRCTITGMEAPASVSTTDPGGSSPDWSQIPQDVLCPLCDYNLRGLNEPRCPECAYRFEWPAVLDPARRLHPYLYEHHPERNLQSFISTALHGLLSERFWRSLNPAQPSRPNRLRNYWILCLLVFLSAALGAAAVSGVTMQRQEAANNAAEFAAMRAYYQSMLAQPDLDAQRRQLLQTQFSRESARLAPPVISTVLRFSARAIIEMAPFMITLAVWPWATLLTLMIFRKSMRRAAVKTIHVRRCCLYGFDGLWWAGLLLFATESFGAGWILLAIPFGAWKLYCAYEYYLRFDRPMATVLSAQVIVILAIIQFWLALNIWGLDRWMWRMMRSLS